MQFIGGQAVPIEEPLAAKAAAADSPVEAPQITDDDIPF
jgi:hypothetical protein